MLLPLGAVRLRADLGEFLKRHRQGKLEGVAFGTQARLRRVPVSRDSHWLISSAVLRGRDPPHSMPCLIFSGLGGSMSRMASNRDRPPQLRQRHARRRATRQIAGAGGAATAPYLP